MRNLIISTICIVALAGCASSQRDFIPNGSGVTLQPTNPAHIEVLNSVPRGMVIGTVLVDRARMKKTSDIIEAARQKAAAVGGDFIVWEDSLGTSPSTSPTPGETGVPQPNSGELAHPAALPELLPEQSTEKTPRARFTVGIFLPGQH